MTRLEKIWGYAMQVFYKTCDVVSFFSGVDRSHNIWAHDSDSDALADSIASQCPFLRRAILNFQVRRHCENSRCVREKEMRSDGGEDQRKNFKMPVVSDGY